jgi:hypothetical protein
MLRLLETPAADTKTGAREPDEVRGGRAGDPLFRLAVATAGDVDAERTLLVAVGPSLLRVVRGVLGTPGQRWKTLCKNRWWPSTRASAVCGESTTLHFACRVAVQTAMNARRRAGYRTRHTPSAEPAELADLALDERSRRSSSPPINGERVCASFSASSRRAGGGARVALRARIHDRRDGGLDAGPRQHGTEPPSSRALSKLRVRIQADGALLETIRGGA